MQCRETHVLCVHRHLTRLSYFTGLPSPPKKIRTADNQLVGLSDVIRRNEPPMGSELRIDEVDRTDTKIVNSMTTTL